MQAVFQAVLVVVRQLLSGPVHHDVALSGGDDGDTPELLPVPDHDRVPHFAARVRDAHAKHLVIECSNQDLVG